MFRTPRGDREERLEKEISKAESAVKSLIKGLGKRAGELGANRENITDEKKRYQIGCYRTFNEFKLYSKALAESNEAIFEKNPKEAASAAEQVFRIYDLFLSNTVGFENKLQEITGYQELVALTELYIRSWNSIGQELAKASGERGIEVLKELLRKKLK
jgi:hypothetical protein